MYVCLYVCGILCRIFDIAKDDNKLELSSSFNVHQKEKSHVASRLLPQLWFFIHNFKNTNLWLISTFSSLFCCWKLWILQPCQNRNFSIKFVLRWFFLVAIHKVFARVYMRLLILIYILHPKQFKMKLQKRNAILWRHSGPTRPWNNRFYKTLQPGSYLKFSSLD